MHDEVAPDPSEGFAAAWLMADRIKGWLTKEQAQLLWDQAEMLPPGSTVVEIGSHQGRSTVVLARAVAPRGGTVVAIDPFVEGRLFGGKATQTVFAANIDNAGVAAQIQLIRDYSTRARPTWTRAIQCLYIDGKHDYWTLSDDLRWSSHLDEGGPILIHDCFSSIGVTLGVIVHVLPSRRLRYLRRAGSLALFEVGRPSVSDRLRIVRELPWWLRNVGIKILLRLRLRGFARLVGHDSPYDPY